MNRIGVVAFVGISGCVAENSQFAGPGFYDPVDDATPAAVWAAATGDDPLWTISRCAIEANDATPKRWAWRFGRAGDCSDAALFGSPTTSMARRVLTTVEIPVERAITFSFETRVSLPVCDRGALFGGRVDIVRNGTMAEGLGFPEQLPAVGREETWFAGDISQWTRVERTLELADTDELLQLRFGMVLPYECLTLDDPADPCKPSSGAAQCSEVVTCCEEAFAPGPDGSSPVYGGWQLDEIRLEVEDTP